MDNIGNKSLKTYCTFVQLKISVLHLHKQLGSTLM